MILPVWEQYKTHGELQANRAQWEYEMMSKGLKSASQISLNMHQIVSLKLAILHKLTKHRKVNSPILSGYKPLPPQTSYYHIINAKKHKKSVTKQENITANTKYPGEASSVVRHVTSAAKRSAELENNVWLSYGSNVWALYHAQSQPNISCVGYRPRSV